MDRERVRRKRRRARTLATLLIVILLVALILLVGFAVYCVVYVSKVDGQWVREEDYSDEIASEIAIWMSDVEGIDIDVDWVKSQGDGLNLDVVMEVEKDGMNGGSYRIYVDEKDYEDCRKRALSTASACLIEAISTRLNEENYSESSTPQEVETQVKDILGMTMDEYLTSNGLAFVPSYEEVSKAVNEAGTYDVNLHNFTFNTDGKSSVKKYLYSDECLLFPEESLVYRKQVAK